ncbi:MFS transporter [Actinoplanes auranticolor]|uniref:MFS transporter n=1 Tax=Actinoplanes auranticolor TaxID=47988 RepID=A0A919SMX9_9ACTN|nr:MFS transporter [Actinoplanes auranticolor]GIM75780.1 MFS transporter [Actinoplanes auranticolor]
MSETLRRSRIATALLFLLYGALIGTWTARIPAVKQQLGLSDGRLSIALVGLALGAVTGMQLSGRLVDRYGSRRIMIPAALVDGCFLLPVAAAPSLVTLTAALFVFGVVHGVLNIAMNARAVEIERAAERPIMSSFHAVYSIGGFLGAVLGGATAAAGLRPLGTFAVVAVLGAALAWWSRGWSAALTDPGDAPAGGAGEAGARQVPLSGVLMLGTLALCALVGEGAAADWSTVYLRDSLESTEGFAAAAFAAFFIAMTAGRLTGDRLAARFGAVRLVRGCGLLAAAGLGTALLIGQPVAGVIGFGCLGAGLSCVAPQVFSAAGHRNPQRPAQAIARVASIGWLGFFAGPVLIGGAAEVFGLPMALSIPVLLALLVAVAAGALRPAREPGAEILSRR